MKERMFLMFLLVAASSLFMFLVSSNNFGRFLSSSSDGASTVVFKKKNPVNNTTSNSSHQKIEMLQKKLIDRDTELQEIKTRMKQMKQNNEAQVKELQNQLDSARNQLQNITSIQITTTLRSPATNAAMVTAQQQQPAKVQLQGQEVMIQRRAVAFVTLSVDECNAARISHIIETINDCYYNQTCSVFYDVWCLHDHQKLPVDSIERQKSEELLKGLQTKYGNSHKFQYEQQSYANFKKHPPNLPFDFPAKNTVSSKKSFLDFVMRHQYDYAWHMEDDTWYTGRWSTFLQEYATDRNQYDRYGLVTNARTNPEGTKNWPHWSWCYFVLEKTKSSKTKNTTNNHHVVDSKSSSSRHHYGMWSGQQQPKKKHCTSISATTVLWHMLRVSLPYATELLESVLNQTVVGMHEGVMAQFCEIQSSCQMSIFNNTKIGFQVNGGWGKWKNSSDQTLERMNPKPNLLYHPVKCASYIHQEELVSQLNYG